MGVLATSLALGLRQMWDGAVLRVLLKSLAVTLVLFVIVATAGWFALDWLLARSGLEDTLFTGAGALRGALSLLLALLGLWVIWRIVAMGVINFYADDVVQAVERRHYPDAAHQARDLPLGEQLRAALAAAGRALVANLIAAPIALVLLFTGVGPFLVFWLANAVLLGRELQDMVWLRHRHARGQRAPVRKAERFALGGVVAGLLAIPFANLLAPILGATSATHLVHRRLRAHESS
ncbi:EI24 domain-containing protein [Aurantiacibacter gangjinensis]|uniref:Uncharacterized protein n=1 Tax=Aurantiacibacter gangjinensis TaxID=502682 RepID=A0A0G9MLE5_9SPHN|nr:EI24 domain-containing protein [Aurantiacibacter gangjinensis]APE27457.1 membrane protein [Aurantiacibacter gangjinensis]KLE31525.1 hypothetical protein AAW01_08125 [Aurantiacibacter gangjinensis]